MQPTYAGGAPPPHSLAQHALRQRQKAVVQEMIRSAVPIPGGSHEADGRGPAATSGVGGGAAVAGPMTWKLLVYDDVGRDIIAPLLKVGDLRELGVTLHLPLRKRRDPVPSAPAVYLCAPTEENIAAIAKDCVDELYEWVYLNFTSPVPRRVLESLAEQLAGGQRLTSIRHIKVIDRTLSYVALQDDLFSLRLPRSLALTNSRATTEAAMEAHLTAIVQGLAHVLLSQQVLPVIAHSRTGVAEAVARRLSVCLSDHLAERTLSPVVSPVHGRPLLLLVDRSSDLATALHHPFTYRGLLVDNFHMALNKVTVTVEGKEKVFELDPDTDQFYRANALEDFGAVSGHANAALKAYKEEHAGLSAQHDGDDGGGDGAGVSRILAHAPRLAEQKRSLDAHMTLAYAVLHLIRQRDLDKFHGVELGLLQQEGIDKEQFTRLLKGLGTPEDRMRLYLIAALLADDGEQALVEKSLPLLGDTPFPALQYIKHLRSWSMRASSPTTMAPQGSGALQGLGWGLAQALTKSITSTLTGAQELELPLTRLVDALLHDGAGAPATASSLGMGGGGSGGSATVRAQLLDTVVGHDPRTKQSVNLGAVRFSQVTVFAIGGGSVNEYDDLKRWEAAHPRKSVTYGCTDLLSGDDMLRQLAELGEEVSA